MLKYAVENGMISIQSIQEKVEMTKREKLLEQHPYKIWQSENGKWHTYIPDEQKKRVLKKRNTKKEIEDLVIAYIKETQEVIYIKNVFDEWVEKKLACGEIRKQSYDRYHTDFKRFFESSSISNIPFKKITEVDLEDFIKMSIHERHLTQKAYSGLRLLIRGIFKYAKKKNYTQISITHFFGDLELSRNIFANNKKDKHDEVFLEDEVPLIYNYVQENPTIWNLGVLLTFVTGMRVGELAALKREDVDDKIIRVRRTEIKYIDAETGKWVADVSDFTKTDAGCRNIILTKQAAEILRQIIKVNPFGVYLFENQGKRIRENTFNKRLQAICRDIGIKPRSIHKVRKTYGTTLIDSNVDDSIIAEQLGHADIGTTRKYYYFSNKNDDKKREQLEGVKVI